MYTKNDIKELVRKEISAFSDSFFDLIVAFVSDALKHYDLSNRIAQKPEEYTVVFFIVYYTKQ
ncbi:MAG: hypothetical protein HWN65_05430 [Candidatus Helarchaeota archaeon]|nr:hypothetical protein [Candidatus Helarchaeota archaeon]